MTGNTNHSNGYMGNRLFIYGAGGGGKQVYFDCFKLYREIIFIDQNEEKQINGYLGRRVISLDNYCKRYREMPEHELVVAVSDKYESEIIQVLEGIGLEENKDYFRKDIFSKKIYRYNRSLIDREDVTIISNNCWGGWVYRQFGLQYQSPTIGCFFLADDYIRFIRNLSYYLSCPIEFIRPEEAHQAKEARAFVTSWGKYPIGRIEDVDIHFLHYGSEAEVLEKWNRRKERINYSNILVKFSQQNLWTEELCYEFNELNIKNKIFFSANYMKGMDHQIVFTGDNRRHDIRSEAPEYKMYMDMAAILNGME